MRSFARAFISICLFCLSYAQLIISILLKWTKLTRSSNQYRTRHGAWLVLPLCSLLKKKEERKQRKKIRITLFPLGIGVEFFSNRWLLIFPSFSKLMLCKQWTEQVRTFKTKSRLVYAVARKCTIFDLFLVMRLMQRDTFALARVSTLSHPHSTTKGQTAESSNIMSGQMPYH